MGDVFHVIGEAQSKPCLDRVSVVSLSQGQMPKEYISFLGKSQILNLCFIVLYRFTATLGLPLLC